MLGLNKVKWLVGFCITGESIASVAAGNVPDNSRFNKRPMLGPISKVENCARHDDDVFAVVSVMLRYWVALGRGEKEQEMKLALMLCIVEAIQ